MHEAEVRSRTIKGNFAKIPLFIYQISVLILLFAVGSVTISGFTSMSTVLALLVMASFLGIAAGGQTFAILLGGIDLSIPSVIGVANVMVGQLSGKHWPFVWTMIVILLVAVVLGLINGIVSKVFGIHPLITTLGTGSIAAGGLYVWTGGNVAGQGPTWLNALVAMNGKIGFIPLPPVVLVWALYSLVIVLLLYKTAWGKRLYATGINTTAARYALVNTTSVWAAAFVLSAVSAAIAGILLAGFSGSAYFDIGQPYLFTTVGAVVIGGTSMVGGRGGYDRTIFGALLLTIVNTLLIGYGLDSSLQESFLGLVILVLLGFYGRQQSLRLRM